MAQESPLLLVIEALPQGLAVRAERIDRRTPPDLAAPSPKPAPQRTGITVRRLFELDRSRREIRVRLRDQPTPRQSQDPTVVTGCAKRQHHVDHGQPGAD
jgi:hypothetical protein